jgi:hypothetical protein
MPQTKHAAAHKARKILSLRKFVSCAFGAQGRLPEFSTQKAPDARSGAFVASGKADQFRR